MQNGITTKHMGVGSYFFLNYKSGDQLYKCRDPVSGL